MFNAVPLYPAQPGEPAESLFPIRERLRLRDNLGLCLREMRRRPGFANLARGPWHVFTAIACHWQANAEAWPSQETIAAFSGYSSRAVREYVRVLERGGLLRVRRERRSNGGERLYYGPGLVMLIELRAFVERFPKGTAKARAASNAAEGTSGTPAEAGSGEPRDQDQIEPYSWREPPAQTRPSRPVDKEEQVTVTAQDEMIARNALTERMKRKHPGRSSLRWFDAGDIAIVAACSAALEGDAAEKRAAHRDAIAGAFLASKDGPPTVRFIWGKLDHFLDHLERGRRRRLAGEKSARLRVSVESGARASSLQQLAIPAEQMSADLERLFGPGWRRGSRARDPGRPRLVQAACE